MIGDLTVQSGFQNPLGQLLQQPALTGELQTRRTSLFHHLGDELIVDPVSHRPRRSTLRHLVSIDLGDHDIRHQVLLLDQELHRSFYSPYRRLKDQGYGGSGSRGRPV
ncbi:hypothetical protein [Micromonospora sp. NPDC047730]|uniref:hypothetical protein n=1 Tax=unclassified Micromonospora TaxID=2617518 RepID=UPI00371A08DF